MQGRVFRRGEKERSVYPYSSSSSFQPMHVQMQMQMHPNVSALLVFCCLFFFLFPKREVLSRLGYAAFGNGVERLDP